MLTKLKCLLKTPAETFWFCNTVKQGLSQKLVPLTFVFRPQKDFEDKKEAVMEV